ncbi:hypothetical protein CGMCC3_g17312 [Colletotrichum fructicola]|uniref:Uncharacterized protein n=1 Tax=Colletotrichum fructicola (strain Nara gc5) TaxID=1213859 RepID=L2FHD1_COLFN|nr:uncharacterized protein CGMCC3_g17312 [Colletotrichum fructicola]KAE9566535.1 hypothetical protein CGMCC3_g17312 [Colletotrichum fructicola]
MDDTTTIQSLRRRKSQPNSPVSNSENLPLQDFRQYTARSSSLVSTGQGVQPEQLESSDETSLLNEAGSLNGAAKHISSPTRWNALGLFGIFVLVLGSIGIVVGMTLLAYIWRSSMRAQAGHMDNGQIWDLIIDKKLAFGNRNCHNRRHSRLSWLSDGHPYWHDCLPFDRKDWRAYEIGCAGIDAQGLVYISVQPSLKIDIEDATCHCCLCRGSFDSNV